MAWGKGGRPDLAKRNRENALHGMTHSSEFNIWMKMRSRCEKENDKDYFKYGGRGISVCERWQTFENFYADMGNRPDGMTLDRKDNNKSYSPDNCRWATSKEQARNRRSSKIIEYNGQSMCIAEWADKLGIERKALEMRLRATSVEDAFSRPYVARRPNKKTKEV